MGHFDSFIAFKWYLWYSICMKICYTGGGTLGHVVPALAVNQKLKKNMRVDALWIGGKNAMIQDLVEKEGISYRAVPSGKLRRYFSLKNGSDVFLIFIAFVSSFFILKKFKPDVLFSKGGYVSVPTVFAASFLHIPIITHESDYNMGLANRLNCRKAQIVATGFQMHEKTIKKAKVVFTGNPVQEAFEEEKGTYELPFLSHRKPTLLVLGGSQGAEEINTLIHATLDELLVFTNVIHQCGKGKKRGIQREGYFETELFTHHMADVYRAATLVVCRCGAGTLSELSATAKPAVLIPLRNGSRGEQEANARYFEKRNAAVLLKENYNRADFVKTVHALLANKVKLSSLSENLKQMKSSNSSQIIADLIIKLAKVKEK